MSYSWSWLYLVESDLLKMEEHTHPIKIKRTARASHLVKVSLRMYTDRIELKRIVTALILASSTRDPYPIAKIFTMAAPKTQKSPVSQYRLQMFILVLSRFLLFMIFA